MPKTYRSVDEIVLSLTRGEQVIVNKLRMLIRECLPFATEKNSYGVPFYSHNRMICYIWPPSIVWASNKDPNMERGVQLGFCQGYKFANEDGVLLAERRKQVYCMYIKSVKEINEVRIRSLLFEADMIDQEFAKKKRKPGKPISTNKKSDH